MKEVSNHRSMDESGENRGEQQLDNAVSQSGLDESQGIELLTEHAVDGESHVDRLVKDEGAEDGGVSRTENDSEDLKGKSEMRDAREETVVRMNGTGQQGNLQGSNDLKSTMKLGDAVEDDARAVATSLTALLASLKAALSEVTGSSLEHMRSENEAAGQVQDVAIDAATKGNRFINACLRLNEEMKGMNLVATQLYPLKQAQSS